MVCGAPSSVTVKSFAVRPSTGLPFLSLTVTVSTTNCVLDWNVAGLFWPPAASVNARNVMRAWRMLEPYPQTGLDVSHGVRRTGQAELRAGDVGVPTGIRYVVEGVGGVNSQVHIECVAQTERAAH